MASLDSQISLGASRPTIRLANALKAAVNEYGHLVLAAPDAGASDLREENLHSWAIKFDLQNDLVRELFSDPVLDAAKAQLLAEGYPLDRHDLVVAEATAKAATDAGFLPADQRRQILQRYNELLDEHGVSREFVPAVLDDVKQIFRGTGDGKLYKGSGASGDTWTSSLQGIPESRGPHQGIRNRQGSGGEGSSSGLSKQRATTVRASAFGVDVLAEAAIKGGSRCFVYLRAVP